MIANEIYFSFSEVKNTKKGLNFGKFPLQNSNFPTKSHIDQTYAEMSSKLCTNQWTNSDMENYGEYAHFGPLKIEKIEKNVKGHGRIRTHDPQHRSWVHY